MKTNLEIFVEVAVHLLTQNRKATNYDRGVCRYLAPNGDKCAVGCLIKKEFYVPEIEEHAIHYATPELIKALNDSGVPQEPDTYELLQKLQYIHDNELVQDWEKELISLHSSFFNSSEKFESQKFMDDLKLKSVGCENAS